MGSTARDNSTGREARPLVEAQDRFVAAWGQMGSVWGISRTMAEVHALLYITGEPMCTDDVMERLRISRGNASMSLRALVDWGIVARANKRGDRKEYFRAEQDVWTMARAIVRQRIKREIDPMLAGLYEIRDMTRPDAKPARRTDRDPVAEHHRRLDALVDLTITLQRASQMFVSSKGSGLRAAASMLGSAVFDQPSKGASTTRSGPRARSEPGGENP
ncbi:MAG: ArsR family transcriptional regulator [Phycisphaeraceae bacterium]|nr:ArsR family transcriptional regulator [Phycisphaerae bacterium]MBX3392182.1 ArsR family transcriptional regulator [Phycisphaeraceae bacterium]